jgi:predicted nucleotidyltransferase
LGKATGLSVNACKYSLDFMLRKGLVGLDKVGRTYQYQADLDNYLARQWKTVFSLEELEKVQIVRNILETGKGVIGITLYGSVAIGRDDRNSDIDVLVIADTDQKGKRQIAALAHGTERELNISVYTPSEWKEKAKKDRIFYEHVIIDSISLYGEKPVVI